MFSRFEGVKAGATEGADSINNVDKVLQTIGVSLRDTNGNFVDLGTIIDEVGQKWNTLNDFQKNQVATAVAGARQVNSFIALMSNYNNALDYQKAELESTGLSTQRYGAYLDSVAASAAKAQTAWQGLWSDTINSQGIKFFYDLSSAIANIIDKSGGLNTVLMILGTTLLFLKGDAILGAAGAFLDYVSSINLATGATTIFNAVLDANPLGLIALAISGIIIAFNAFGDSAKNLSDKIQSLQSDYNNLLNSFNQTVDAKKSIDVLGNQLDNLRNKTSLSADDQKKLIDVQNQLKQVMPSLSGEYDSQGNFILNESVNIKTLNTLLQQKLDLEQQELNLKASDMIKAETDAYVKQAETLSNLQKGQATFTPWGIQNKGQLQQATSEAAAGVQQSLNTIETAYEGFDAAQKKAFLDYLDSLGKSGAALKEQLIQLDAGTGTINNYASAVTNYADAGVRAIERDGASIGDYADAATRALNSQKETIQAVIPQLESLDTTLKTLQSDNKTLDDIITKSQGNKLTFDDVQKLLAISPDYINALSVEGDTVKVNTDLLRQYQIAQADKAVADAKAAGATDIQIKVLQAYADQLKTAAAESKSYTDTFTSMIASTMNQMTAQQALSGGFQKLSSNLDEYNKMFKSGQITADQYFAAINKDLKNTDFSKMFAQNSAAAKTFFAGMALNATQALSQINASFQAGDISISQYTSALTQITKTFTYLGSIVKDFGSALGLSSSEISSITSSMGDMANQAQKLSALQQLNIDLEGAMADQAKGTLDKTSQSYTDAMMKIATAAASSGQTFTDMQGKALVGAQNIYGYITSSAANFNDFANQAAGKTGNIINTIIHDVGQMVSALGEAISNFRGSITISPVVSGGMTAGGLVQSILTGAPLQLPTISLQVGTSGLSFQSIGAALSSFGSSLQGTNITLDSSIYTLPDQLNQISGAAGDAANSIKDIGSALTKAAGGAKDLTSQLDKMKTTAEDALNAQLAGYKSIIDAQKQMIDNTLQQRTYEEDIANQNQSIAQIKNRLLAIQFDTSDAANAERLTLTDELNKAQQKLSDTEAKQSADVQKAALDADYAAFETRIKTAIDAIKAINATSVSDLATQISQILANIGKPPSTAFRVQTFHSGIDVGAVGGGSGSSASEVFAMLMKGERVINEDQMNRFVNRTLPQITSNAANNSGITFAKLFDLNVQGNLDSSVLPDLEKLSNDIVNRLNQTMIGRGFIRSTSQTGVV